MVDIKKRRILAKDWNSIALYIKDQLKQRKDSKFRTRAEKIWKEVDRQVSMESMSRQANNPNTKDWRSALELGELSRASEVLSADIRRLTFPQNRQWFEVHSELPQELDQNGDPVQDGHLQRRIDGGVRALMAQQNLDFGLKARTDLSVKEALHHGSYVVEVRMENLLRVHDGMKVEPVRAPVWVPHSMWNCYPDPSASIVGTNMFYNGSMIIKSFMSYYAVQKQKGWMNLNKIDDPGKDKDLELITFFGDVSMTRKDGDIFLPNSKIIVINDHVVFYQANPIPFPQIIYNGYERLDVRDPYFVSPLIKMSPAQKIASVLVNKYLDNVDLKVEPPIVYDGNDPDLVAQGGIDLSPGSSTPSKNLANFKVIDVGDPSYALQGLQFMMTELQKGTSVDAIRSGMSSGTEQTATEVERTRQGAQIRTVDFVDKHELHGLRPFLYIQHELNKRELKDYQFYNPEMDAPDFERVGKEDLPKNVHFDVVGSKGLIEEQQRQAQTLAWTQFMLSSPLTANLVNVIEIAKEGYRDAGHKDPERFLNLTDERDAQQTIVELQQKLQEYEQGIQELQQALEEAESKQQEKMAELELKQQVEGEKLSQEGEKTEAELTLKRETVEAEIQIKIDKLEADLELAQTKLEEELRLKELEINLDHQQKMKALDPEGYDEPIDKSELENTISNFESTIKELKQAHEELKQAHLTPKVVIRDEQGLITEIRNKT